MSLASTKDELLIMISVCFQLLLRYSGNVKGCEVGQVGLVPRNGSNYSTVQLCVHDTVSRGEFRDVCGDRWGERETRVACNELGYSTTEGQEMFMNVTSEESKNSVTVQCAEKQTRLINCTSELEAPCHSIAQVICAPCSAGVRLVDGNSNLDGSVEMCSGGVWESACGESWGRLETLTTCTQLGFTSPKGVGKINQRSANRPVSVLLNCSASNSTGPPPTLAECRTNTMCLVNTSPYIYCSSATTSTTTLIVVSTPTTEMPTPSPSTLPTLTSSLPTLTPSLPTLTPSLPTSTSSPQLSLPPTTVSRCSISSCHLQLASLTPSIYPTIPESPKEKGHSHTLTILLALGVLLIATGIGVIVAIVVSSSILKQRAKRMYHINEHSAQTNQDVVEINNNTYDSVPMSTLNQEPEADPENKYDLSNPIYMESNYFLVCPVYEDVVEAVGDYEVAVQNSGRLSTLEEEEEEGEEREGEQEERGEREGDEDSVKFDDDIYCTLK